MSEICVNRLFDLHVRYRCKLSALVFIFFCPSFLFAQTPIFTLQCNRLDSKYTVSNNVVVSASTLSLTADRFGNPCEAFFFDGVSSYLALAPNNRLDNILSDFTITSWIRPMISTQNDGIWATVMCKGESAAESPNNPQFRFQVMQNNFQSTVSLNTDFTEFDVNFGKHPITEGKWVFMAFRYSNNEVAVYMDGQQVFSFPYAKPCISNSDTLFIGLDRPGKTEYFYGDMDDISLFDYPLSDSEIRRMYEKKGEQKGGIITCPSSKTLYTSASRCTSKLDFDLPQINSNCDNVQVIQKSGPSIGSNVSPGSYTLVFQASSSSGSKKTCYCTVNVLDTISPVYVGSLDTLIITTEASIDYKLPVGLFSDNCGSVEVALNSGISAPVVLFPGKHELHYSATDSSGNKKDITINVVVEKRAAPIADVPSINTEKAVPEPTTLVEELDSTNLTTTSDSSLQKPIASNSPKSSSTIMYEKGDWSFKSAVITAVFYDNREIDHDSISVYIDGKLSIDQLEISKRESLSLVRYITINGGDVNLSIEPLNIGNTPPNTLQIDFYDGYVTNSRKLTHRKPLYSTTIKSKPGEVHKLILHNGNIK